MWVVNGFFVFMPSLNVDQTNNVVGGWTAFVGGSIFEVGSYLMILEALNRKHEVPRPQLTVVDGRYVSGTQLEVYSAVRITSIIVTSPLQQRRERFQKRRRNNSGYGSVQDGMNLVSLPVQFNYSERQYSGFQRSLVSPM